MGFFNNIFNGAKDLFGADGSIGWDGTYSGARTAPIVRDDVITNIPIPQRKPTPPSTTNVYGSGSGDFFGQAGDFLNKVGGIAEKGVNIFFGTKSKIEQLKTAQKLEEVKLDAITKSAKQAPAPAQVILPTFTDFLNDPREAASRVTPAALAGSGAINAGVSTLTLALGGLALVMFLRR